MSFVFQMPHKPRTVSLEPVILRARCWPPPVWPPVQVYHPQPLAVDPTPPDSFPVGLAAPPVDLTAPLEANLGSGPSLPPYRQYSAAQPTDAISSPQLQAGPFIESSRRRIASAPPVLVPIADAVAMGLDLAGAAASSTDIYTSMDRSVALSENDLSRLEPWNRFTSL